MNYPELLHFAGDFSVSNGLFLRLQFTCLCKLFLEAIYAAFGIDQLLASSKERMATGANFNTQVALVGGAGSEAGTARADHFHFFVGGVNPCFHDFGIPFDKLLSNGERSEGYSLRCRLSAERRSLPGDEVGLISLAWAVALNAETPHADACGVS